MLEGFFASPRLAAARVADPEAAAAIEAEAREKLAEGHVALGRGELAEAIAAFDAGIRAIARAAAIVAASRDRDQQAIAQAYARLTAQSRNYLDVLEAADTLDASDRAIAADLRADLERAEKKFQEDEIFAAEAAARATYSGVVALVSEVRSGHSVFVERSFKSARDEYEYERERHESYALLVEIAVAERGEEQPTLAALAARVNDESTQLFARAEGEHAAGDSVAAIRTLEHATERLLAILRAAGLPVAE